MKTAQPKQLDTLRSGLLGKIMVRHLISFPSHVYFDHQNIMRCACYFNNRWVKKGCKKSLKHCGGYREKGRKRAFINQKLEVKLGNMKQWWEDEKEKLFDTTIQSMQLHMLLSFRQNTWVKITGSIILFLEVEVKICLHPSFTYKYMHQNYYWSIVALNCNVLCQKSAPFWSG